MMPVGNLLKIRIKSEKTGGSYPLLGFKSSGNDSSGYVLQSVTLLDEYARRVHTVDDIKILKELSIINEK